MKRLLLTIGILCFYSGIYSQNIDFEWIHSLNQIDETRDFSTIISITTTYTAVAVPVTMGVAALIDNNDELLKNSIYILAASAVTGILTQGIKHTVKRPRPFDDSAYPYEIIRYDKYDKYENVGHSPSFPSGHTSFAFATATALTLKYPRWYVIVPSYVWACSVGYSRMNLGVHYPSDVAAGAVLGAGSAYLTYLVNEWFWGKTGNRKILTDKNKTIAEVWF